MKEEIESIDRQIKALNEKKQALVMVKEEPQALPENVVKISFKRSIGSHVSEIIDKAAKFETIELIAMGKAISKAFFVAADSNLREKLIYNVTIPSFNGIPDNKDPSKKFQKVSIRLLLVRIGGA